MQQVLVLLTLIWINACLSGCASSKAKVFGDDLPSMKAIHAERFQQADEEPIAKPIRPLEDDLTREPGEPMNIAAQSLPVFNEFQWQPNPTLVMYVFPHKTHAGYPVPGYATFFRMRACDQLIPVDPNNAFH